jgi:hypothetical protein
MRLSSLGYPVLATIVVSCLLAGRQASALNNIQSEGANQPNACVTVANGSATPGTPVLAAACGGAFDAFWQLQRSAVVGPGTDKQNINCLFVSTRRFVIIASCNLNFLPTSAQWYYSDGQLISRRFPNFCLDSNGNYTNSNQGTFAQLTVNPCDFSPTQMWRLN